jgi:(p)ppGpp synthase/HD superfamily hydrolase
MSNEPAPAEQPFVLPSGDIPMWMIGKPDVLGALAFASAAHRFQRRKYTLQPYIYHPMSVATRLYLFYKDEVGINCPVPMLQAALLHDTVEDTGVTFGEIEKTFGFDVAALVYWLTDLPMPGTNRETRKRLNAERLAHAPSAALIVKHFDLEDNTESIELYDPKFAKTYIPEKERVRKFTEVAVRDAWLVSTRDYQAKAGPLA